VYGYTSDEYKAQFVHWMAEHQKMYTAEEFLNRFEIFKANMDYVRDWNAQGSPTVLGLNIFADLSNAEYRNIYLGTRYDGSARLANPEIFEAPTSPNAVAVDWRAKGYVTAIKDQGQCGSCWSFSTTGGIEGAWFKSNSKLVSLSEQNLMDCSFGQGNLGCNGGLMTRAFQYVINNKGIDTEESYPYTAKTSLSCHFKAENVGATISSYVSIAAGNEAALVDALDKIGPISVAIDASHNSFQLYKSGVYYEPTCSSSKLDHGVLAVGYGTDDATKADYYIVKNSWGTVWGTQGYINMARNRNNNCGIATQASYPIAPKV
jgi:cathepsin L